MHDKQKLISIYYANENGYFSFSVKECLPRLGMKSKATLYEDLRIFGLPKRGGKKVKICLKCFYKPDLCLCDGVPHG